MEELPDINEVYYTLFDEALERYNAKQKRSDRKIDDYYEKIRRGKQEKLFYEVIFQIGNKDDMNVQSDEGQLAKDILCEFMEQSDTIDRLQEKVSDLERLECHFGREQVQSIVER